MYRYAYEEFVSESGAESRDREAAAFDHAIDLLGQASSDGADAAMFEDALRFNEQLWLILIEDLSSPENLLPEATRASLISIGIWMLKQTGRARGGETVSLREMAEIDCIIRDGLK